MTFFQTNKSSNHNLILKCIQISIFAYSETTKRFFDCIHQIFFTLFSTFTLSLR